MGPDPLAIQPYTLSVPGTIMDSHHFQDLNQPKYLLRARILTLEDRDGLQTHLIEALPSTASEPVSLPLILLLHGFPELGYSWRKVLGPLSTAREGYHVVAPDLRGYGRTITQSDGAHEQIQYDDSIAPFHLLNIAEDIYSFVKALGHDSVALLVGHDFGSLVAGYCVTARPNLFRAVVFMSAPFTGVEQPLQLHRGDGSENARTKATSPTTLAHAISTTLATLTPPRKHYTSYFATRDANRDMLGDSNEDLYRFLGGYYHMKSGAWEGNTTHPLPSALNPTIDAITHDLATLPDYYVMPAHENMRQLIERHASQHPYTRFTWPPEDAEDGRVYASEFARTGFQGGLNYYRSVLSPPPADLVEPLIALAGRQVSVPAAFISGARDWGVYQTPGALDKMRYRFGIQSNDVVLIDGAGHWVQQEAPDQVIAALLQFLERVERTFT